MRLFRKTVCVCIALTLMPGVVFADAAGAESTAQRLDRLEGTLELAAREARGNRQIAALGQGGLGLVTLVPGIILIKRADEVRHFIGMGFVIGGAAQLATAPLSLLPTPVERIHDALANGKQSTDPLALLRTSETRLRDAAQREHTKRLIIGGIDLAIGVASLVGGMLTILADDGLFGLSRTSQLNLAATLMGVGSPFALGGLRFLLVSSHEEVAWQSYSHGAPVVAARPKPHAWQVSIGVPPASRGACATLGTRF